MQSKTGTVHKGGHPQVKRIILNLLIKTLEETGQYYNVRYNDDDLVGESRYTRIWCQ